MSDWNNKIIEEFRAKGGRGVGPFGDQLALLTTRGAKSGRAHTTPLAYHRDGDRYIVIASMGGAPKHPAWYHNLMTHPDAELEVGSEKFRVRATPVERGPERDRLYAQQAAMMPGFLEYEKKTTRIIPAVVLERVEDTAADARAA
jgi:deazaflavin-dependent oxidoreductase (nitroreductase family)